MRELGIETAKTQARQNNDGQILNGKLNNKDKTQTRSLKRLEPTVLDLDPTNIKFENLKYNNGGL